MESKDIMKLSVERLENDLERISSIVRTVESELGNVCDAANRQSLVLAMKVQLSEIHARLDGVREFVMACRRRALEPRVEEDIDLWL
ncbi:MAG: hypothetical protein WEB33_07870 [Bacteroidota bacterium]